MSKSSGILYILGLGGVGRTIIEFLPLSNLIPKKYWQEIVIIEPNDIENIPAFISLRDDGDKVSHISITLTKNTMKKVLRDIIVEHSIILDCTVDVDAIKVMQVAKERECVYANSSMEDWDFPESNHIQNTYKGLIGRSLYSRIQKARKLLSSDNNTSGTFLADMGMNPGLISLYAMRGLYDYAIHTSNAKALKYISKNKFAECARELGLRTIQITENDTQITRFTKSKSTTFYNTWSAKGLFAECIDPVQLGYGTHDRLTQPHMIPRSGPKNIAVLPIRGMDMKMFAYTPSRKSGTLKKFVGYSIPHGESNTISEKLTVYSTTGEAVYRPTVFFVYKPCPIAERSLEEFRKSEYTSIPERYEVLRGEQIKSGYDAIGVLMHFHSSASETEHPNIQSWWSGSVLDISDMQRIGIKFAGPTTVQVAASMLSAVRCILLSKHPLGFITPEDLEFKDVISSARKFLGKDYSIPVSVNVPPDLRFESFIV